MHTHLLSDGADVHDSAGSTEIGVMLANGVTTVRLIGTPEQLALRRVVAQGRLVGPQLWVASPQMTGRASENALVVTTPEEARSARRQYFRRVLKHLDGAPVISTGQPRTTHSRGDQDARHSQHRI